MPKTLKLNLILILAGLVVGLLGLGWIQSRRRGGELIAGCNGDGPMGPAGELVDLAAVAPGSE